MKRARVNDDDDVPPILLKKQRHRRAPLPPPVLVPLPRFFWPLARADRFTVLYLSLRSCIVRDKANPGRVLKFYEPGSGLSAKLAGQLEHALTGVAGVRLPSSHFCPQAETLSPREVQHVDAFGHNVAWTLPAIDGPFLHEAGVLAGLTPAQRIYLVHRLWVFLARIHSRQVTHGDLKLSNIALRSDGRPIVTDWELASVHVDAHDAHTSLHRRRMSWTCMPPEVRAVMTQEGAPRPGSALEELPESVHAYGMDVYALGQLTLQIVHGHPTADPRVTPRKELTLFRNPGPWQTLFCTVFHYNPRRRRSALVMVHFLRTHWAALAKAV